MVFNVQNSKGDVYYLHRKGMLSYFSKEKKGCIEKPKGFVVMINKQTGLPFMKKS